MESSDINYCIVVQVGKHLSVEGNFIMYGLFDLTCSKARGQDHRPRTTVLYREHFTCVAFVCMTPFSITSFSFQILVHFFQFYKCSPFLSWEYSRLQPLDRYKLQEASSPFRQTSPQPVVYQDMQLTGPHPAFRQGKAGRGLGTRLAIDISHSVILYTTPAY